MRVEKPIDYSILPKKDCARYKMHKYWAAKPWYVVAEYIKHFTEEGEIVLDPFCGSGVVGCEALIHRRKAILNDLNPIATFITENTCIAPVDLDKLEREFSNIDENIKEKIMDMYQLKQSCPYCGKPLYAKHVVRGPSLNGQWIVEARCTNNHGRKGHIRRLLSPEEKAHIQAVEKYPVPHWYPKDIFPGGRETMRLKNAGLDSVDKLYTRRNLIALSLLRNEIMKIRDEQIRNLMLLAFSNTLLHVSKLKSENLRPMSANSYYCMGDWIEENVWLRFENRVKWHWGIFKGKQETNSLINGYYRKAEKFEDLLSNGTFMLLNRPAQNLSQIPDKSVDYCFTDPPYGGSIQYFELTFLWRAWLGMKNDFMKYEITVNNFQKKNTASFENMLIQAFSEIYRILKPGRWLTVTFNNSDVKIWKSLIKACKVSGFEIINIVPQKPLGSSFVQSWAGRSLIRDLILNFRKPATYTTKVFKKLTKSADMKNLIVQSANEILSQTKKASLAEIYEAAVMKWIGYIYKSVNVKNPDAKKQFLYLEDEFDIQIADRILSEAGFEKIIEANRVYYRKSNLEKTD